MVVVRLKLNNVFKVTLCYSIWCGLMFFFCFFFIAEVCNLGYSCILFGEINLLDVS